MEEIKSNNNHIIVGEGKRCLCGVYDGESISCEEIIRTLNNLVRHTGSNTFITVGRTDCEMIYKTISPLIKNCE